MAIITHAKRAIAQLNREIRNVNDADTLPVKYFDYIHEMSLLRSHVRMERTVECIFTSLMMRNHKGRVVNTRSRVNPRGSTHALDLIKSGRPFLDWDSASCINERANLLFDNGSSLGAIFTASNQLLSEVNAIRNYIAHDSDSSYQKFITVVQRHKGTPPIKKITAGQFLRDTKITPTGSVSYTVYYIDGFVSMFKSMI